MSAAKDPLGLVGQTLEGRYRLERVIGQGGFSFVYRATNLATNEPVAVKCLKVDAGGELESSEAFVRRFRDEGRLLHRLSQGSADIVRCLVGGATTSPVTGDLVPFLVLEWLAGRTLSADLRERRAAGLRGRTLAETLELFEPVALALDHAHRFGVVHRDIKPANLFLAQMPDGATRLKVLDFGVAKIVSGAIGVTMAATAGNLLLCSPSYAAPEQFEPGLAPIGPWTDVYALTLILLESLRDARVRHAKGVVDGMIETLDREARLSAGDLGIDVSAGVERVLSSGVAFDPRARPQLAGDLWRELAAQARQAAPRHEPAVDLSATIAEPERFVTRPLVETVPLPGRPQAAPNPGWAARTLPLPGAPAAAARWTPPSSAPASSLGPPAPPTVPSSGALLPLPVSSRRPSAAPGSLRAGSTRPRPGRRGGRAGLAVALIVAALAVAALVVEVLAWSKMRH